MTAFEMAKGYYPQLWSRERLQALLAAGRLTQEEYTAITQEKETEKTAP